MIKSKKILDTSPLLIGIVLVLALSARLNAFYFQSADEIYRSGDFTEDVMLFGGTANFDGSIVGDLVAATRTLTFDGTLDGNLNAACYRIIVNGEICRSLRAFAENVNINAQIDGDVTAFANEVTIGNETSIGRDIALFGNEFLVDGTIGRDTYLYGNIVTLSGRIEGNLKIKASNISIAPGAFVGGDFSYESKEKARISPEAQILGETKWKKLTGDDSFSLALSMPPPWGIIWSIVFMLGSIILGVLVLMVRRDLVLLTVEEIKSNGAIAGFLGLAIILLLPFALILTAITGVGIPAALTGAAFYGVLFFLGKVIAAIAFGAILLGLMRKGKRVSLGWSLILGTILIALLYKIPVLGWIVYIVVWAVGAGAITMLVFKRKPRAIDEAVAGH